MIQPLRTWHRRIILSLSFLLPILFVAGLLERHVWSVRKHVTTSKFIETHGTQEKHDTQTAERGVG